MERLLKKLESMTLEEFNGMMGRFIDRTKKMMNISKLMQNVKQHIETDSATWNNFFNTKLHRHDNEKPTNFHINQQWMNMKFDDEAGRGEDDGTGRGDTYL